MDNALLKLAYEAADAVGLERQLVAALVEQESNWDRYAIRFEPAFYQKYIVKLGLPITEAMARSFSFGVCQVMGEVAREFGFKGKWLTQLCDPAINLEVGCRVLKHKIDSKNGDVTAGLLAWNGGAAPNYANEVLARKKNYPASI